MTEYDEIDAIMKGGCSNCHSKNNLNKTNENTVICTHCGCVHTQTIKDGMSFFEYEYGVPVKSLERDETEHILGVSNFDKSLMELKEKVQLEEIKIHEFDEEVLK
jgi:hypothetical protein